VSANGSGSGSGFELDPFLSIENAVSMIQAGENIYVKEVSYSLIVTLVIAKSVTSASVMSLFDYPGKQTVLNFS
jgi:hypothetical protein